MFDADTSTLDIQPHGLRVGDHVTIDRDVLAEVGREAAGLPPTWFCVPAGTRGQLIGWRARDEDSRAIIDLIGTDRRVIVFVGERNVTRAARELYAPPPPRPPSLRRHRPRHRG